MNSPSQKHWLRIARQVRRKVNCGWAMEYLSLPVVISCILTAAAVLTLRRYSQHFDQTLTLSIALPVLILIGTLFAIRSRKKHETDKDAFVRLESNMGLHSALTAAHAGKTSWPIVPEKISAGIQWKYSRLTLPLIGSLALLIASFTIPIKAQPVVLPSAAPQAWDKLTADLEELKEKDVVQEEYIKEVEKKLEELKQQPQKDWFSHPSLEATENLKQAHSKELKKLSRNLDKAEKALSTLKKYSQQLNEAQKSKLLDQYNNAMKAMEKGNMKPNKELLDQLKNVDPNMLNNLTPEQMEQLKKNLQNMSEELKKQLRDAMQGKQPGEGDGEGDGEEPGEGQGEGSQNGEDRGLDPFGPGQGGLQRGPGHAPKVLGGEAPDLKSGEHQKLKPKDLKNSLPGDLLETTDGGKHDVDKSKSQQQAGGNTENKGAGGDSVWKNNYLPKEKRALKKFFK